MWTFLIDMKIYSCLDWATHNKPMAPYTPAVTFFVSPVAAEIEVVSRSGNILASPH
jgi:hypothetical protein